MLIVCSYRSTSAHDIHISFGKAAIETDRARVSITIYKDDLLRALNAWHQGGYAGMSATEFDALEARYVAAYFRLWEDREQRTPIVTHTEDGASQTFTLEFKLGTGTHTITLDNRILLREFTDQSNVMQIAVHGETRSHVFTSSSTTYYISM